MLSNVGVGAMALAALTTAGHTLTIVGGEKASTGEFPFAVSLVRELEDVSCGGSLIHPSWVLTAAHCITNLGPDDLIAVAGRVDMSDLSFLFPKDDDDDGSRNDGGGSGGDDGESPSPTVSSSPSPSAAGGSPSPSAAAPPGKSPSPSVSPKNRDAKSSGDLFVALREHARAKGLPAGVQASEITALYSHFLYDEGVSYDIALARLADPFNTTETVAPIPLVTAEAYPDLFTAHGMVSASAPKLVAKDKPDHGFSGGAKARFPSITFVGWGDVGTEVHGRGDLLKLPLPTLDPRACVGDYPGAVVSTRDVCAGGVEGKDTCNGDSGGPAIIKGEGVFVGRGSGAGRNGTAGAGSAASGAHSAGPKGWALAGVQSRGTTSECADIDTLVLSTKVSEFIPWVEDMIARHSAAPGRMQPSVHLLVASFLLTAALATFVV